MAQTHQNAPKTYFITGASSGLGLSLSLKALRTGHHVIGTSRNVAAAAASQPEFEKLGGQWLQLDPAIPSAEQTIAAALESYESSHKAKAAGMVDWVIVHNAGYALQGTLEDSSETQIQAYVQTMFYGAIHVLKGTVPTLRKNRKGTLINMSSILGFVAFPEAMLYCALKAAVDSLWEGYADLLGPFDVSVITLLPGTFVSDLAKNSVYGDLGTPEDYQERLAGWMYFVRTQAEQGGLSKGDPEKLAARVVEIVDGTGMAEKLNLDKWKGKVMMVPMGSDAYGGWGPKLETLQATYSEMKDIALSTDIA